VTDLRYGFHRVALSISLVVLAGESAFGQTADQLEVASVRRNVNGGLNTQIQYVGPRLTVTNASLKTLIRNAYEILSFQLAGEQNWFDTEMFDITAITDGPAITKESFPKLLRALLSDRFDLKVHWESRETILLALVPGRGGPRVVKSSARTTPSINTSKAPHAAKMRGEAEPIAILAGNLGNQLRRYVLDRTGLDGLYDWVLEWDPDPGADATLPSLQKAVEEQLGLKLQSQKGPMPVLVVEQAARPSEN
jgi:uncharacterized protein (TIGR03435 family)